MGNAVVHQLDVFLRGQGCAFPSGAADAQGIHAKFQLPVDLPGKGLIVNGAGRQKGGDQCCAGPGKNRCFHTNSFPYAKRHKKTAQTGFCQTLW